MDRIGGVADDQRLGLDPPPLEARRAGAAEQQALQDEGRGRGSRRSQSSPMSVR